MTARKKRTKKNRRSQRTAEHSLLVPTQQLCHLYHIKPAHAKGQNFLVNPETYQKIIDLAQIDHLQTVLEVGPGLGFLTAGLAGQAKEVIAVELDKRLAEVLVSRLKTQGLKNVRVLNKNVLDLNDRQLPLHYQIVANLPYNITSVFLRKFLEQKHRPQFMVLMLQKEVAERLIAGPGQASLLSLSVQFYAKPSLAFEVPASDFWPSPKVDSAVVRLDLLPQSGWPVAEAKPFFRLLKFGFSSKRKMLKNNLAGGLHLPVEQLAQELAKIGLKSTVRAQELSLKDWQKLFGQLKEFVV